MKPPLILDGLGDRACLPLMVGHLCTRPDGKAVPDADGGQGKHQRKQLLFAEVRPCALEDAVGHLTFRDPGDGVGERERRAFALGAKGRLLPRVGRKESLLGSAGGAGVFRMRFGTIRAPIVPLLLVDRRPARNPSVKLTLLSVAASTMIRHLWPHVHTDRDRLH